MLILIMGPTGAGKSEIIYRLVKRNGLTYISPEITRPLRPGEWDKISLNEENFSLREAMGEYVMVNSFFGYRYGTPRRITEAALSDALPVYILDFPIEASAGLSTMHGFKTGILIMPPSAKVLIDRLERAGRADRVEYALQQFSLYYDRAVRQQHWLLGSRIVVNNDLEASYDAVVRILNTVR